MNGFSVAALRVTSYASAGNACRHSSSVLKTFDDFADMNNPAFVLPFFKIPGRSTLLAALVVLTTVFSLSSGLIRTDRASAAKLVAPTKVCANQPASGGKVAMRKAIRAMTCMVNYARKKRGLKRYRQHGKLVWSARRKARDIIRCDFSHSACGRDFAFWIQKSGYSGGRIAENIAWGSGYVGSVRKIFIAWMKSPPHRRAILSSQYSHVGAGVVKGKFKGYRGARSWVLHFGAR